MIGHTVLSLAQVPSTNDYALELLSKSNPREGTVVLTAHQTAGRGQIGSVWESAPDNNVCMSVILYPRFLAVGAQFLLSQAVSLAVAEACAALTGAAFRVKWPNDVYHRQGKVAGLLIQNTLQGRRLGASVVGIGLNVNQERFLSDAPNPMSLAQITGRSLDLEAVYRALFQALSKWYEILSSGHHGVITAAYEGALYRRDRVTTFERREDGQRFLGIIRGTTPEGLLRIALDDEREEVFAFKSIRLLMPA